MTGAQQVAQAVIGCWQDGEVPGLQVDDLSFEKARSLTRPAMTYVRGQLRGRLTARLVSVTGAGYIPPAAADPATGSSSTASAGWHRTRQSVHSVRNLDGTGPTATAELSGSVRGEPLLFRHGWLGWPWRPDSEPAHLA